jgi:hypothetical protein
MIRVERTYVRSESDRRGPTVRRAISRRAYCGKAASAGEESRWREPASIGAPFNQRRTAGFLLYAAEVALAPLALVQSIAAGGIGVHERLPVAAATLVLREPVRGASSAACAYWPSSP